MTSLTPNGSDDSMAINHYMLRVEFYGYERTAMESNLQNAIEKIQRMDVTYKAPPYRCETPWEVSNAAINRRMWDREVPGACKTSGYSAVEIY